MATESTKEHEKIKPFSQATQRFSKQSLYRAMGRSYKNFPCASVTSRIDDFHFSVFFRGFRGHY